MSIRISGTDYRFDGGTITSAIAFPDGTAALPSITFSTDTSKGFYHAGSNAIGVSMAGAQRQLFSNTQHIMNNSTYIGFTATSASTGAVVSRLYGYDGANNTWGFRDGATANTVNIYSTWTDASNYERISIAAGTEHTITSEAAGTGTVRDIALMGANVGIGTLTPAQLLEVHEDTDGITALMVNNEDTGVSASARIILTNAGTTLEGAIGVGSAAYTAVPAWADAMFVNAGSGLSGGMHIRADTGGMYFYQNSTSVADMWLVPAKPILAFNEADSDPTTTDLDSLDSGAVYFKNDKFVIAYNNASTMTYISIPLDGSTTTWTHSTSAP